MDLHEFENSPEFLAKRFLPMMFRLVTDEEVRFLPFWHPFWVRSMLDRLPGMELRLSPATDSFNPSD